MKKNKFKKVVHCPRCGRFMGKSRNKNYDYECNFCDEDFFSCEIGSHLGI